MFGFLKKEKIVKTVALDKPVLVMGNDLRLKINERKNAFDSQIKEFNEVLVAKYTTCIEGTPKSDEKRVIQKQINDLQVKKIWLDKLLTVINDEYEYALSISEGVTLGIVENVE